MPVRQSIFLLELNEFSSALCVHEGQAFDVCTPGKTT